MKGKRILSAVLSFVMIFTCFSALALTLPLAVSATGATATTKAIWVGPSERYSQVPSQVIFPLVRDGTYGDNTVAEFTAKIKMISGTKPYLGMYRAVNPGDSNKNKTVRNMVSWCDNANSYIDSDGIFHCTVTFKDIPGDGNCFKGDYWNGETQTRYAAEGSVAKWGVLHIGNMAHDDDNHMPLSGKYDFSTEFIMTDAHLTLTSISGGSGGVVGTDLAPSVDNFDEGKLYSFVSANKKGAYNNAHNHAFNAEVGKWSAYSTDEDTVRQVTVADDIFDGGTHTYTKHAETDYEIEYYTCSDFGDKKFEKVGTCYSVIDNDTAKKAFVIKSHAGDTNDPATSTGSYPQATYANIFIPLNIHKYFSAYDGASGTSWNNLTEDNSNFKLKVSLKAKRLSGTGQPIVGKCYAYSYVTSESQEPRQGMPNPSTARAYNNNCGPMSEASAASSYVTSSYNVATGDYEAVIKIESGYYTQLSRTGISTYITIGLAEHTTDGFDACATDTSFIISDIKFTVYGMGESDTALFGGENQAPKMSAANCDAVTSYKFMYPWGDKEYLNGTLNVGMRNAPLNRFSVEGAVQNVSLINDNECNRNSCTLTRHAATDTTLEYWSCATHNKNYSDEFATTELASVSATKKMIVVGTSSNKIAGAFITMDNDGWVGDKYFIFKCKMKLSAGGSIPFITGYRTSYWGGTGTFYPGDRTSQTAKDGVVTKWVNYDPATCTYTAAFFMFRADPYDYDQLKYYNAATGAHTAIMLGNYIPTSGQNPGVTDTAYDTRFAFTDPEIYEAVDAAEGTYTGDNLCAPVTDKTVDFSSGYKYSGCTKIGTEWADHSTASIMNAPLGTWSKVDLSSIVTLADIPNGYFEGEAVTEKARMIRLGGYGNNQQAFHFATELTRGTTYQYDIDYRACGGVNALYKPQFSNTSTGFESLDYYNNSFTVSTSDTGTHYSIRFTMPDNAKINANNFIIYLGQKWPLRRNGTVYFANASLYKVSGGNLEGSNLIPNGDFHLGTPGKVTDSTKNEVFSGWELNQVMTYPGIYLLDIPEGFFDDNTNMNLQNVYEFKGGDVYKPQFDFHFAAGKTYRLTYDYYCDDNDTVNAYILSKDNSVTAVKDSRISNTKFRAVYTITTAANTKQYTDQASANGSIRFALNGNSYAKSFRISNIKMYVVEGGNPVGANLVMSVNPCLDDKYYGVDLPGDEYAFSVAKNDSNCDSNKNNIAIGWVGNLDYNNASNEATYSKVIKTNGHLFDNYTSEKKMKYMRNALLESGEGYNPFNDTGSRFYDPKADGIKDIRDLIKLKKNIINNVYNYNVANEQTNGGIYGSVSTVACYGDSITQGMGYESNLGKTYPGRLNTMLGSGYTVVNCGDPGERSYTIMARQGALSLGTSKTITFEAGQSQVHIGVNSDNGFLTRKGDYIDLTSRLGNERSINNVTIEGRTYEVIMTDFTWSPRSCNIYLKRSGDVSQALTIPKGAPVTFSSYTRQNECDIYLIGANGVYTSANDLVAQYKAMVDRHGSNNFLIIIPFWNDYCDVPFREAFGDHCVSFREVAITTGLAYEGITPTETDNQYIANGEVPPSLLYYPNNPDVHLNAKGYDLLAHILYEQGSTIGIW